MLGVVLYIAPPYDCIYHKNSARTVSDGDACVAETHFIDIYTSETTMPLNNTQCLFCLITSFPSKDIWCHVQPYSVLCLQITKSPN